MSVDEQLTPQVLQAICTAHRLGEIRQVVQPAQGNINRCLIVNDAYVLRFDVLEWGGINRYAGEQWAYDLLRDTDVPVPQVVALDTSKRLAPYDYLILTKMPGEPISTSAAELSPASRYEIGYTAGQYLATLHSHHFDQFGLLYQLAAGTPNADWAAYVAEHFAYYLGQVKALDVLPADVERRIDAMIARMQPLMAEVRQGVLIHGDYHFLNLLQQDGKISAVLDFDWAASGDPSWDFRIDQQIEREVPDSRDAFYAGYTSRRPLPDGHWERLAFYRVGLYLDFLEMAGLAQDAADIVETLQDIVVELDWLDAHL